jgi:cyclohexyl-isocyanide hydratase
VSDQLASPPLKIAMLAYPAMTLLDLVGPQTVFSPHAETYLVWETLDPITTDSGIVVTPNSTFESCPQDLDILFAPGGYGTYDAMENERAIVFMADRGRTAKYVTSVCSGSLILAAAGLLEGYRAASHWGCYEVLKEFGVTPDHSRVCIDRNRITGGGVTAGIDFGLRVLAELRGEEAAKISQLVMEYAPEPPFNSGSPESAGPELTAIVGGMLKGLEEHGIAVARQLRAKRLAST